MYTPLNVKRPEKKISRSNVLSIRTILKSFDIYREKMTNDTLVRVLSSRSSAHQEKLSKGSEATFTFAYIYEGRHVSLSLSADYLSLSEQT